MQIVLDNGAAMCCQRSTVSCTRCYLHPVNPVLTSAAFRDEAADYLHECIGLYLYRTALQLCDGSSLIEASMKRSTYLSTYSKYDHSSRSLNKRK